MTIKILNLYAGIGGNRKLWDGDIEVIAVELDPRIAEIYQKHFPNDKVIVRDAHQYLLKHFKEFDFIWASPPCTTHSSMAKLCGNSDDFKRGNHKKDPQFPDMKLYEEIIFLEHYFKGKWVVENVKSYYKALIEPQVLQRHFYWANFNITPLKIAHDNIKWGKIAEWEEKFGFDLSGYVKLDKRKALRNCVDPKMGVHIFNCAFKDNEIGLFAFQQENER